MPGCHHCHHHDDNHHNTPAYRRVLWLSFVLNIIMFVVEMSYGWEQHSTALKADALDFFGDSVTYLVTLVVLGMSLKTRARAGWAKGFSLMLFGAVVLADGLWNIWTGHIPAPQVMGLIGICALVVNVVCALMLYYFRNGDSNVRSVWVCSRNDAIGNIAVVAAAGLIAVLGSNWPDVIVGIGMALLGLQSGWVVCKLARNELNHVKEHTHHDH